MSVSDLNPQYTIGMKAVKRCRDTYIGQAAIKAHKDDGVTPYFPMYVPVDQSRYNRVIELSSFTNFTAHTVDKLVGAAFNEKPKTNLEDNATMSYMLEDADGSGGDLQQLATNVVLNNTVAGRHGLLVNYPSTAGQVLSKEEVAQLKLRASIHQYPAETIPNWGVKNGKLHYIVLLEDKLDDETDMFSHDSTIGRRVYYIDDKDKKCYQQFVEDGAEFLEAGGTLVSDFSGVGLDYIPMIIVGAVDNKPNVDQPPISGMCDVNIAHYQISVIETENLSIHGQLTLAVTANLSVDEWKAANPNGVSIGANSGLFLGDKGGLHTATAPESSALPAAKEAKKQELIAVGGNLIEKNGTEKTAKEAGIQAKEQTSIMMNVVNNVSDAIEVCLGWAEQMMAASPVGDFEYRINTEFFDKTISAELFTASLQAVDRQMLDADAQQQIVKQTFPTVMFNENSVEAAGEGQ